MPTSRTEIPGIILTCKAAGTIVTQRAVSGNPDALTQTAAAARSIGIAVTGGATGDLIPVATEGMVLAEAGAAIAANALLEVDSVGRLVTKASGVAVAQAFGATTAAGQLLQVLLLSN